MARDCWRTHLAGAALAVLAVAACGAAGARAATLPPAPHRAGDFLATLCVVTHLEYTDGQYANASNVIADLAYLGMHCLRETAPDPAGGIPYLNYVSSLRAAAAAHNSFDFLTGPGEPIAVSLGQIDNLQAAYPGAVIAVEGPNEINNNPPRYNGLTGDAAAVAYQSALYAAVRADPLLARVPIYDFTGFNGPVSLAAMPGRADYANAHPYPNQGEQPKHRIEQEFASDYSTFGPLGAVITEIGYYDRPTNPYGSGVDDATQAKGSLNILADAFRIGIRRTFLYQLLSAYPDPAGTNVDTEYGLFRLDNTPKPAARAIHALTTILADAATNARSFRVIDPGITLTGLPATGDRLLLQKANGTYELLIWAEPVFWNEATHSPVAAKPVTVTLNLPAAYATRLLYDPTSGSAPIATLPGTGKVGVSIVDHPVIVELTP